MAKIENNNLIVEINQLGAEITSIIRKSDQHQSFSPSLEN